MKAWADRTLSPDPAAASIGESKAGGGEQISKNKAQTVVALRRAKKIEVETNILQQRFHDAESCRRRRLMQIEDLKRRFLGIADSLPAEKEIKELVRQKILAALHSFGAAPG
jgi:hypothetical protein